MIEIKGVKKNFGDIEAVRELSADITEGKVYGLVGTNGAGKSTLLRMAAGVLKPEEGKILVDGEEVFENPHAKEKICFIADTGWFFPNATPESMGNFYKIAYPAFDRKRYQRMLEHAGLPGRRKLRTFSKGMKKQVSVLLGVCANTKYLLCDETFDGLDPVMRQAVKKIFAAEMVDRDFTPVIASHNMRELEDICDQVGLLHGGRILFSENLEDMKFHMQKVQCVLPDKAREEELLRELDVLQFSHRGTLLTFVARGTNLEVVRAVESKNPIFAEALPLTLEEIFISATETAGYEVDRLFEP
ncbi:MAG: ABC transporter ATP-binding protein [Lachnospiraceae bacterium]|nr:ABC transporter ATP-binding protein [Lachnospiraceae bacterium]